MSGDLRKYGRHFHLPSGREVWVSPSVFRFRDVVRVSLVSGFGHALSGVAHEGLWRIRRVESRGARDGRYDAADRAALRECCRIVAASPTPKSEGYR